jgi:thiosulfate dehydrogenase
MKNILVLFVLALAAALLTTCSESPAREPVSVLMCDGKTSIQVAPGATPEEGRHIADALMEQWRRSNPQSPWEEAVRRSHPRIPRPHDNRELLSGEQNRGHASGALTEQDLALWERETYRTVLEGARVFHSAKELGSTIAVSCDMCHPDASNTHPETYPKYQVQLGRVVLLRDMINWCLEHPVRAKPMTAEDPRMRAMEAYILAERKGRPLDYGRH